MFILYEGDGACVVCIYVVAFCMHVCHVHVYQHNCHSCKSVFGVLLILFFSDLYTDIAL